MRVAGCKWWQVSSPCQQHHCFTAIIAVHLEGRGADDGQRWADGDGDAQDGSCVKLLGFCLELTDLERRRTNDGERWADGDGDAQDGATPQQIDERQRARQAGRHAAAGLELLKFKILC